MALETSYAVARGRKVGIFSTWAEAEAQVKGFKGALHQRCASREAALRFLIEQQVALPSLLEMEAIQLGLLPETGGPGGAWYAVARGRQPGLYSRWRGPDGAESQLGRLPSACWRAFPRREAALIWLRFQGALLDPALAAETDAALRTLPPLPTGKDGDGRWNVAVFAVACCERHGERGGYEMTLLGGGRRDRDGAGFAATTYERATLHAWCAALERLKRPAAASIYAPEEARALIEAASVGHWRGLRSRAENGDLWERLGRAAGVHQIVWVGLDAHPELFACEQAARSAAETALAMMTDAGYEAQALFPD